MTTECDFTGQLLHLRAHSLPMIAERIAVAHGNTRRRSVLSELPLPELCTVEYQFPGKNPATIS